MLTRGFVTLATGNELYYKLAMNMLHSFKLHNPETKMAILCDRENEYTTEFDDVVVIENVQNNYLDKFRLFIDCPYDENIFIKPDCLIYKNLSFFWELLSKQSDFTSFGWNDTDFFWFEDKERLKKTLCKAGFDRLDTVPMINPGYLFLRKSENCRRMFEQAMRIVDAIQADSKLKLDKKAFCRSSLRDDPVLEYVMKLNGCKCEAKPSLGKCIFVPSGYDILKIDIEKGALDVRDRRRKIFTDCNILHFSTRRTEEEGLYLWQLKILNAVYFNKSKVKIAFWKSTTGKAICYCYRFVLRNIRNLYKEF